MMESNTSELTNEIRRFNHRVERWITIIGLLTLPMFIFAASRWLNLPLRDHIIYLSAYLIVYTVLVVYLSICRQKDSVLEQQYLQWQIMRWKEDEDKSRAALQKDETIKRRESEQRQQDTNLYLKFLDGSKGDMNELEKLLNSYKAYIEKSKS